MTSTWLPKFSRDIGYLRLSSHSVSQHYWVPSLSKAHRQGKKIIKWKRHGHCIWATRVTDEQMNHENVGPNVGTLERDRESHSFCLSGPEAWEQGGQRMGAWMDKQELSRWCWGKGSDQKLAGNGVWNDANDITIFCSLVLEYFFPLLETFLRSSQSVTCHLTQTSPHLQMVHANFWFGSLRWKLFLFYLKMQSKHIPYLQVRGKFF